MEGAWGQLFLLFELFLDEMHGKFVF
jgi:hypothetical protein